MAKAPKKAAKKVVGGKNRTKTASKALAQTPVTRGAKEAPAKKALSATRIRRPQVNASPARATRQTFRRPLPESVDEHTIARLVAEAEAGIPAEKLRRRGRPAIGDQAASTYSVRLPDDLVTLVDVRSGIDRVTRGETIRRALIEYLTK